MMSGIYQWIRNLAGYLVFLAVLEQLLPAKKYGKYIQLFAGMVLIVLILRPVTHSGRLAERVAKAYRELEFQYEAEDLRREILGVEEKQLSRLIEQYESAVAADIRKIAEEMGIGVLSCSAAICENESDEYFGTVTGIELEISRAEEPAAVRLQKRLASYYRLEESYVEIRMSEGER